MAQYYSDFSNDALGSLPSGTELKRSSASGDYQVEDSSVAKRLQYLVPTGSSAHRGLAFPISCSGAVDLRVSFRDVNSSNPPSGRLVVYASDDNSSEYALFLDITSPTPGNRILALSRRVGGTFAVVQQATGLSPTPNSTNTYSLRLFVTPGSPNNLKAKHWNYGEEEPASWLFDTTDSALTLTTGWVGILGFAIADEILYVEVGIGTDGDPAPSAPLRKPSPLLLTPW